VGVFILIYWQLFSLFARVSLLAFGGALGILPEIQAIVVDQYHWMTAEALVQTYVVGQFVPGPNMVMATLVGYKVAGFTGAIVSTLGMYLGPVTIVFICTALYYRNRQKDYVRRIELALRPLVLGLILAATLLFLTQQLQAEWPIGLAIGLPIVWLHWHKRISAITGVFAIGVIWYASGLIELIGTR
jgi:chromate transporter